MKYSKSFISIIFVVFCYSYAIYASEIKYDIYHYPKKLNIIVQFTVDDTEITKLTIPSKIWGHDLSKQINNVKILSNNALLKDLDVLHHKKNSHVSISYDVVNISTVRSNKYFYTQSFKEGFFFLHDFALIHPQYPDNSNVIINYHTNRSSKNFYISETIKTGKKIFTTLEELKGGISVSGNNKILSIAKSDNSIMLGFDLKQKDFSKLQYLTNKILYSQQDICNCGIKSESNNFIFIGNKSEYQSYRGSVFKDNSILFLIPNLIDELTFINLASHENFHKLIGSKRFIRFNPVAMEKHKWFSEGFTDFFAQKNNLKHNLITYKEYLSSYNKVIQRYFTSHYRKNSNAQLALQYWKNPEVNQTLYDRGHIIANELDLAINQNSDSNLDDVLCIMLARFQKEKNLYFSNDIFTEAIKSITKKDLKLKINNLIDGNINLSEILENKLPQESKKLESKLYLIPQYIDSSEKEACCK